MLIVNGKVKSTFGHADDLFDQLTLDWCIGARED